MELGRGPLHGGILHQVILFSRLGWKVHNVDNVDNVDRYLYMCVVHVCMYLFCNFFDTSFGEQTSQLRIKEIILHSV